MKALVIYDSTGYIWNIIYGAEKEPLGLKCLWVDIPDGAILERIDITDLNNPKAVFNYLPETDIGKLQKQALTFASQISHLSQISGIGVEANLLNKPTLEELKEAKRLEVNAACGQTICNGVTVELSTSFEHFSLSQTDQLNLFGLQAQIASGAQDIIYHADGQPCRFYPASDIALLIEKAMFHASYHTTYANSLRSWIDSAETAEELQEIYYGADVPEEYRSEVLKAYLAQVAAMAGGE